MPRLASSLVALTLVLSTIIPGGYAGPACVQRHRGTVQACMQTCGSRWGWPGSIMGQDRWGAVMKPNDGEMGSVISQACGGSSTGTNASPSSTAAVASTSVIENVAPTVSIPPQITTTSAVIVTSSIAVNTSSALTSSSVDSTSFSASSSTFTPDTTSTFVAPSTSSTPPPPETTSSSSSDPPPQTTSQPQEVVQPTTAAAATTSTPPPAATTSSDSSNSGSSSSGSDSGSGSSSSGGSVSSADQQAYLDAHNSVRAQHGAVALTWDNNLEAKAQQWANNCVFKHSGGTLGPFGENLAAGTGDSYTIQSAVESWTNEVSQYNPSDPQASHFTQVVWKASTTVGCAEADCDGIFAASFGKAHFHVCEYSVQGNVIGEFAQNVQV